MAISLVVRWRFVRGLGVMDESALTERFLIVAARDRAGKLGFHENEGERVLKQTQEDMPELAQALKLEEVLRRLEVRAHIVHCFTQLRTRSAQMGPGTCIAFACKEALELGLPRSDGEDLLLDVMRELGHTNIVLRGEVRARLQVRASILKVGRQRTK